MVKKKMVLKVAMNCQKCQTKALEIVADTNGVESLKLEGEESETIKNKVVVIGDGVDAAELAKRLRKKVGQTTILSLDDFTEDNDR